jgi:hypothetical protein
LKNYGFNGVRERFDNDYRFKEMNVLRDVRSIVIDPGLASARFHLVDMARIFSHLSLCWESIETFYIIDSMYSRHLTGPLPIIDEFETEQQRQR